MFKPRKRRLYTPITPPSDDELDENQSKTEEEAIKSGENQKNVEKSSKKTPENM